MDWFENVIHSWDDNFIFSSHLVLKVIHKSPFSYMYKKKMFCKGVFRKQGISMNKGIHLIHYKYLMISKWSNVAQLICLNN